MHRLMLAVSWVLYLPLLLLTILSMVAGSGYWFQFDFSAEDIVTGLYMTLYFAAILTVPTLMLWQLKSASWGTFAIHTILLGAAFILQSIFQGLAGEPEIGSIFAILGLLSINFSFYFILKHINHVKSIVQKVKTP